jgi:hypothetical protein
MMDPHAGKAAFTLGLFITIPAAALLPFQPPGSGEQAITAAALVVGVVYLAVVALVVRRSLR